LQLERLAEVVVGAKLEADHPGADRVRLGSRSAAIRQVDGFAHVLWKEGQLYYSLVSDQAGAAADRGCPDDGERDR
jgi:hypothetical protein